MKDWLRGCGFGLEGQGSLLVVGSNDACDWLTRYENMYKFRINRIRELWPECNKWVFA